MSTVATILKDEREIEAIWFVNDPNGGGHMIAAGWPTTKIVAYGEPGPHCELPWFAVYHGEHIHARVPALHVTVVYKAAAHG